MDRKTKGRLAEVAVIKELIVLGYDVYAPFSDNCKCDLVASKNGHLLRVSVKYTSVGRAGKWKVSLRQVSRRNHGSIKMENFDKKAFDLLAVYVGPEDRVVLVPVDFANTNELTVDSALARQAGC